MNNLKDFESFVNEELTFKDVKRFGNRIKIEYSYAKINALINLIRYLMYWSANAREETDTLKKTLTRLKRFSIFMLKHDFEYNMDNMPKEELKTYIEKLEVEYEKEFKSSFTDDIKELVKFIFSRMKDNISEKKKKDINRLKKFLEIISENDNTHQEVDPLGEEEWEEGDLVYDMFKPLRTGRRMTKDEFLGYNKENLVGKTVTFLKDGPPELISFRNKIKVADVELVNDNRYFDGIILIDEDGEKYTPQKYEEIRILNK
jgi:hypothetical protein